jgi:hypothetical protein
MYISMGKKTVNGQNPMEPRSPTTSLKKGMSMAIKVVSITNIVLHTSRKKFSWYTPKKGMGTSYSAVTKSLLGHFRALHFSTNANNGWQ